MRAVGFFLPLQRRVSERVNRIKNNRSKRQRCLRVSLLVSIERNSDLCLCFGQDRNVEPVHKEPSLARASAQGTGTMVPSRRPARRRCTSARQASEIPTSSPPSRLSSKAAINAERSSAGRANASSSKWSTRAFIVRSLAPRVGRGTSTPNPSLNHRTRYGGLSWPGLGYTVHSPSPGQAIPPHRAG
jgi:hypothetical protein